jgi:hypothetical protein
MSERRRGLAVIGALAVALATGLLAKGFLQFALVPGAGFDERLQWTSAQYYLRGVDPFPVSFYYQDVVRPTGRTQGPGYLPDVGWPDEVAYPPSSTLVQIALYGWPSVRLARWVFVAFNLVAVAVVVWWSHGLIAGTGARRWLFAGLALLNLGYSQTLINGNYGILVVAALMLAFALRARHPLAAGLLLGLAFVKPTVSAPFLVLLLADRRYRALVVMMVLAIASVALSVALTGTGPWTLVRESLEGTARFAKAPYAIWQLLRALGTGTAVALAVNAAVFVIPFAVVLWRAVTQRTLEASWLSLAALAGLVARLFTYHNSIDNVLLTFLVLALARVAVDRHDARATALATAVVLSVLLPLVWTNSLMGHLLLYTIWLLGVSYVVVIDVWPGAGMRPELQADALPMIPRV